MLDIELLREITKVWLILSSKKKMSLKKIITRIPKERISAEDLKKPEVAKQVSEDGYYDVMHNVSNSTITALEFLTNLGYLEKRQDTMYHVEFAYEAHPYTPFISPFGWVAINPNSISNFGSKTFDSREYKSFDETAMIFKSQQLEGMHPHITLFDYRVSFSYNAVVYEVKDKYFDTIKLSRCEKDCKLIVHLAEPYITSDGKKDSKTLKPLDEIPEEKFLSGSNAIDPFVEKLEWKKKSIGVVVHDDTAFFIVPKDVVEPEKETIFFGGKMPDFFDRGLFSRENFLSRVFEDSIAHFLATQYNYQVQIRLKPSYMNQQEIDVFGEKGVDPKTITVCECKLRIGSTPISLEEIRYFNKKIEKIRENESKRGQISFHFWFATNTTVVEDGVKEFAKVNKIELKLARLSSDWQRRSDFKVEEISNL